MGGCGSLTIQRTTGTFNADVDRIKIGDIEPFSRLINTLSGLTAKRCNYERTIANSVACVCRWKTRENSSLVVM